MYCNTQNSILKKSVIIHNIGMLILGLLIPVTSKVILILSSRNLLSTTTENSSIVKEMTGVFSLPLSISNSMPVLCIYYLVLIFPSTHKTQRINISLKLHILTTTVLIFLLLIIFCFHIFLNEWNGLSLQRILYKQNFVFKFFCFWKSYNLRECNNFSSLNSFFTRVNHMPDYQE